MALLYYPPFRAESEDQLLEQSSTALRAYIEDLSAYDMETLTNAWKDVRRGHKTERWPTINAIRQACGVSTSVAMRGKKVDPRDGYEVCRLDQATIDRWLARWERDQSLVPREMQRILRLGEFAL